MSESRPGWWMALVVALVLQAASSQSAPVGFLATSRLSIALATLPPVVVSNSGTADVTGPLTLTVPGGTFITDVVVPVTDPDASPILGVRIVATNDAGAFAGGTGMMAIKGSSKVCLFGPCSAAVANVNVPLSVVGSGGAVTVAGPVNVTVIGAPWTTGTAAVGTITRMGGNFGGTLGQIRYVTPVFVSTNIGTQPVVPAFADFVLHFAPEPGGPFLLVVGAGILALFGLRRRGGGTE